MQKQLENKEQKSCQNQNINQKIVCFGAGYVGGPTMAVLSNKNPFKKFVVYDINKNLVEQWQKSQPPLYEPGLQQILMQQVGKNLFFTNNIDEALEDADIIFIAVNTPQVQGESSDIFGGLNMNYIWECVKQIASYYNKNKIEKEFISIVEKSTVPVQTCLKIKEILLQNLTEYPENIKKFQIISNPEFLSEGTAIVDLLNPNRVIIGYDKETLNKELILNQIVKMAVKQVKDLYLNWISEEKIIQTNIFSSELSKIVSNAFLAQRISSINSLTPICEKVGADIQEITKIVGKDERIGSKYLNSSIGFGGSCLQKDLFCLIYLAKSLEMDDVAEYWEQVIIMNEKQKQRFVDKIIKNLNAYNERQKTFTITLFGATFKKNTSDCRVSPSLDVACKLLNKGYTIYIHDPQCNLHNIKQSIQNGKLIDENKLKYIHFFSDYKEACNNTDALVVVTEWEQFKHYDYKYIQTQMNQNLKEKLIFDGRNILNGNELIQMGYKYYGIGRNF